jgi:hypothetical protein
MNNLRKLLAKSSIIRRFASEDTKSALVSSEPVVPRLESHYFDTLYEDLMIMNYDHFSPNANVELLEQDQIWSRKFTKEMIENVYSVHLDSLPTKPDLGTCTNIIAAELQDVGLPPTLPGIKKKLRNPIDYTSIPKELFHAPPLPQEFPPYSPLPSRIPALKKIDLKIWAEEAVGNKFFILLMLGLFY